jgi:hypothetical protein
MRLNRTAELPAGFCREAAMDYSPGLQPWVRQIEKRALKVAPDVRETGATNRPSVERTRRSPLSGRSNALPNPGLKPWAILYNRFAVMRHTPRAKALGCSLRPFHDQKLPGSVSFLEPGYA